MTRSIEGFDIENKVDTIIEYEMAGEVPLIT